MARKKAPAPYFRVPKDPKLPLRFFQATITDGFRADGKPNRIYLRSKDENDLLNKIAAEKERISEGLTSENVTVGSWLEFWMSEYVEGGTAPKNADGNRSVIRNHIEPIIGKRRLRAVTPDDIRLVTNAMLAKGLTSTYALNAHNIMSAAFKAAVMERKITRNPTELVKRPVKDFVEQEAFTLDEALRLLESVVTDPADGAMWATSILTGARRGEVIGLEWDRIIELPGADGTPRTYLDMSWQLQRLIWRHGCGQQSGRDAMDRDAFPCGHSRGNDCPSRVLKTRRDFEKRQLLGGLYLTRPKTRSGWRIIPLVDPLKSIIERHREMSQPGKYGLVFPTPSGAPRDPDQTTAAWSVLRDRLGLNEKVVLHGLRHTAVDLLYLAGVPEDLISEIVGHSSRGVTRGYKTKANSERLWSAMEQYAVQFKRPAAFEQPGTRQAIEE